MFGLKIFVRVQTFRRVPPVLPCNFCHPASLSYSLFHLKIDRGKIKVKEEPKDFDEGEGGVGEGDEGDDADGVGQVLLLLIPHLCDVPIDMNSIVFDW